MERAFTNMLCLCWMWSSASLTAAGIVLTKKTPDESPAYWQPIEFSSIENFPTSVVITTKGTKQSQSIPRYHIGELIEFIDFTSASLVNEDHINKLKAARDSAERNAKQCKNATAALSAVVQSYDQVLKKYEEGNVLIAGKWIGRHDYVATLKADQLAATAGSITEVAVGTKTFKNVRVTKVVGDRIGIMHEGGIASFNATEITKATLTTLEAAFPKQFVKEEKPAVVSVPDSKGKPTMPWEEDKVSSAAREHGGRMGNKIQPLPLPTLSSPKEEPPIATQVEYKQATPKIIAYLSKMAQAEDRTAMVDLGVSYFYGDGVPKDPAKAVQLFRAAAQKGSAEGQLNLGVCYFSGIGVAKAPIEGAKYFQIAAESGNAQAQFCLGKCYERGEGVLKNDVEAFTWYERSAKMGFKASALELFVCYSEGRGVLADHSLAVHWMHKSEGSSRRFRDYREHVCLTMAYEQLDARISDLDPNALVPYMANGQWGFKKRDLQVVMPVQFDYATPFVNDIAFVCKDGGYGFISPLGRFVGREVVGLQPQIDHQTVALLLAKYLELPQSELDGIRHPLATNRNRHFDTGVDLGWPAVCGFIMAIYKFAPIDVQMAK